MILGSMAVVPFVSAQADGNGQSTHEAKTDNFYGIDPEEMPQMLREAMSHLYAGGLIKSVEVSNNSTYVKYKVVLVRQDGKMVKVYLDDKCHVVKTYAYFE